MPTPPDLATPPPPPLLAQAAAPDAAPSPTSPALRLRALAVLDWPAARARIARAHKAAHGNTARAARALGIDPRTLWRYFAEDPGLARELGVRRALTCARRGRRAPRR